MRIYSYCVTLLATLSLSLSLYAQEVRTEKKLVYFKLGSSTLDLNYEGNAERLDDIVRFVDEVRADSLARLLQVAFCGSASPEGSYQLNTRLAERRSKALEEVVRARVDLPDSIVMQTTCPYIPWDAFRQEVESSNLKYKEEILAIIDEEPVLVDYPGNTQIDRRVVELRKLHNGIAWKELSDTFYLWMRNAYVIFEVERRVAPLEVVRRVPPYVTELGDDAELRPTPVVEEAWTRRLYLKTNLAAWALMVSNVACEVDLAPHWSFTLPIYYSAMNAFKQTLKLRLFGAQPEVRYWLSEDNDGWFVGGHYGFSYFNVAYGDWRYQDEGRHTPAQGGGVSAGWRKAIGKSGRWRMEFALGAGAYKVRYDKFINEPDGLHVGTGGKTFWGIDQAAVTFGYTFDLKKGGNR